MISFSKFRVVLMGRLVLCFVLSFSHSLLAEQPGLRFPKELKWGGLVNARSARVLIYFDETLHYTKEYFLRTLRSNVGKLQLIPASRFLSKEEFRKDFRKRVSRFDVIVLFLHGSPRVMALDKGLEISARDLEDMPLKDKIIHLGGCLTDADDGQGGKTIAKEIFEKTGAKAVIGFKRIVFQNETEYALLKVLNLPLPSFVGQAGYQMKGEEYWHGDMRSYLGVHARKNSWPKKLARVCSTLLSTRFGLKRNRD